MVMNGGVYEIVNAANGKRYVGSAVNFEKRCGVHRSQLNSNKHHSIALQRAWDKYGAHTFEFRLLLICEPKHLLMYEQRAIDSLAPDYNMSPTAGSTLGVKFTQESRDKISKIHKGKTISPEHIAKVIAANTGRKMSQETKNKISAANLGRIKSEEECAAISARLRGVRRSVESRAKQALTRTGKKHSPETREKMAAAHKMRRGIGGA